jgi:tripartite-type tricarboxylate transporter receptor subunit TctC
MKKTSLIACFVLLFAVGGLQAQDYPTRPVQILIGNIPGGPQDLGVRALIDASKSFFPQPIVPVNKPGGGGSVMTFELIRSAPDGYTIGQTNGSFLTVHPLLQGDQGNLPYKGPEDVQPVVSMFLAKNVFIVKADAPWKTMEELIEYAKGNPGKLRVGFAGVGTSTHTNLISLKMSGVPVTEVPLVGAVDSISAILGGHIEAVVLHPGPVLPHVRAGTLKYLALFSEKQIDTIPELKGTPTLWELGYKDTHTDGGLYLLAVPKNTPMPIVNKLHDAFIKAQKTESFQKFCSDNGYFTEFLGPDELKKELKERYNFYATWLKTAGIEMKKN